LYIAAECTAVAAFLVTTGLQFTAVVDPGVCEFVTNVTHRLLLFCSEPHTLAFNHAKDCLCRKIRFVFTKDTHQVSFAKAESGSGTVKLAVDPHLAAVISEHLFKYLSALRFRRCEGLQVRDKRDGT